MFLPFAGYFFPYFLKYGRASKPEDGFTVCRLFFSRTFVKGAGGRLNPTMVLPFAGCFSRTFYKSTGGRLNPTMVEPFAGSVFPVLFTKVREGV